MRTSAIVFGIIFGAHCIGLEVCAQPQPSSKSLTAASRSFRILPDGSKVNTFTMPDGTTSEVTDHSDHSREIVYHCNDGTTLIISKQSSGDSSAVVIEKNGHRRPLTRQGCDARLQSGGLPSNSMQIPAQKQVMTSPNNYTPQSGVQQFR